MSPFVRRGDIINHISIIKKKSEYNNALNYNDQQHYYNSHLEIAKIYILHESFSLQFENFFKLLSGFDMYYYKYLGNS